MYAKKTYFKTLKMLVGLSSVYQPLTFSDTTGGVGVNI